MCACVCVCVCVCQSRRHFRIGYDERKKSLDEFKQKIKTPTRREHSPTFPLFILSLSLSLSSISLTALSFSIYLSHCSLFLPSIYLSPFFHLFALISLGCHNLIPIPRERHANANDRVQFCSHICKYCPSSVIIAMQIWFFLNILSMMCGYNVQICLCEKQHHEICILQY